MTIHGNYFYGNKISDYGIENKRVDYGTLAKAFDCVLNNNIMEATTIMGVGDWYLKSGFIDNGEEIEELEDKLDFLRTSLDDDDDDDSKINIKEEIIELEDKIDELREEQEYYPEVYQYYIVSDSGAEILKRINEIVWYNEDIDMYLWGVTHFGTSWNYVLTDIEIVD